MGVPPCEPSPLPLRSQRMLSIDDLHDFPGRGLTRREWLHVGGIGLAGLTLPGLLRAQAELPVSRGRAKSCIIFGLVGGPPQHETWDPKPDAPPEVRGAFRPVATNVTGIRIGELMPRTAALMDRVCAL